MVNGNHSAGTEQLNNAVKRKTTPRTEPDCSSSLLLTALRTKHGECSSPTDSYDGLDNSHKKAQMTQKGLCLLVAHRPASIVTRADKRLDQQSDQCFRFTGWN